MPITSNNGGVTYKLDKVSSNIGGVLKTLKKISSNVGGVLHVIHSFGYKNLITITGSRGTYTEEWSEDGKSVTYSFDINVGTSMSSAYIDFALELSEDTDMTFAVTNGTYSVAMANMPIGTSFESIRAPANISGSASGVSGYPSGTGGTIPAGSHTLRFFVQNNGTTGMSYYYVGSFTITFVD